MKSAKMLAIFALALGLASVSLAAEDTWTRKADMPTPRMALSTSVVDGIIYAIGGSRGVNQSTYAIVEAYNPETDVWTTKAPMPTPRGMFSTSVVDGIIYAIGGARGLWLPSLSTVEAYDPATNTWTTKRDMPTPRMALSASVVDGIIYAIGGCTVNDSGMALATVEAYDPATNTWATKAPMPGPKDGFSTCAVDSIIYAIGGGFNHPTALSTVYAYDPKTDTWTEKDDMPTPRAGLSTCGVDGIIYAIGGRIIVHGVGQTAVEAYDPVTNTWMTKTDMPTARSWLSCSTANGKIYAIGGLYQGWSSVATVEEYDTGLIPSPDFNGDFVIDIEDLIILIEHWGQDDPMCDIAPPPFGDGIVDVLDLELLMSYWGQEILPPELIAYWKLDETEGTIAYDSAGEHDSIVNGDPLWQPNGGKIDGAIELDGIDDYISTPFVIDPADGPLSVFAWIKGGAPGQVILSQKEAVDWLLADPSDGKLMTALSKPAGGRIPPTPLVSESIITDNVWHRIGLTWDGTNRVLYVDDVAVASDTQTSLERSNMGLNIGCGPDETSGTFFSGLIDDVRIYNQPMMP